MRKGAHTSTRGETNATPTLATGFLFGEVHDAPSKYSHQTWLSKAVYVVNTCATSYGSLLHIFTTLEAELLARLSAKACPLFAFCGKNFMSYYDNKIAHLARRACRADGLVIRKRRGLTLQMR